MRQALERKDEQPCVTRDGSVFEELPFELIRCLLRRNQQQRRAFLRNGEVVADVRKTTERLATPRRSQEQTDLHDLFWRIVVNTQSQFFELLHLPLTELEIGIVSMTSASSYENGTA